MLYVFKSTASADLIMLEPNGRRLLEIIGKELTPKGIIRPEQMGPAISALQAAIREEGAAPGVAPASGTDESDAARGVTLKQRLFPMIEMLRRCQQSGKDVTWGV